MKPKLHFPLLIAGFVMIVSCEKERGLVENSRETLLSEKNGNLIFNPNNFTNSTLLTNKYFPYRVGIKYVLEAKTKDGFERNEIQRINASKVVMGINVAVIRDIVLVEGELEEDTRDWFAQDNFGNVWYMGEDVDNYNPDGTIRDHEGAWEAGVDGAKAGIIMLADPKPGVSYQQEFSEGIAEDRAKITALNLTVKVPFNTYEDCLKTKEWSTLANGDIGYKFYAPGVGLIKETSKGTVSELVDIEE